MKKLALFSIVLVLVLVGCQPQPVTNSAAPTFAVTLAATPGSDVKPSFEMSFNDPSDPICQPGSYDFGDFSCQGGEYHEVNKENGSIAGTCEGTFKNFILQAQIRLVGNNGAYGVEFRGNNDTPHFYIFMIHPDGKYQLIKWDQIQSNNATLIPWTASPAIKQGEAANVLQVIAQETRLTLFANNQQLASITDASYPEGCVGPVALEEGHAASSTVKVWELP